MVRHGEVSKEHTTGQLFFNPSKPGKDIFITVIKVVLVKGCVSWPLDYNIPKIGIDLSHPIPRQRSVSCPSPGKRDCRTRYHILVAVFLVLNISRMSHCLETLLWTHLNKILFMYVLLSLQQHFFHSCLALLTTKLAKEMPNKIPLGIMYYFIIEEISHNCIQSSITWVELSKGQLISKCPFGVIVWTKIPTKDFDNFCPRILKSGEINKIKALSYNTTIYIWLYWLFKLLKTLFSTFILWFHHFSNSRAEIVNFFRWYFGRNDDTKRTFWN